MGSLLTKCTHTVDEMFRRVQETLEKENVKATIELMFVCFRNYANCDHDGTKSAYGRLLQKSQWHTDPTELKKFMGTIEPNGGTHWEEAVEVGLQYANREAELRQSEVPLKQVILIGDAAPNTKAQVGAGRSKYGESYWRKSEFAEETFWETEVEGLAKKKIPVHTFHVCSSAGPSFKEIAERTQGKHSFLDVQSSSGAEYLTRFVLEQILFDAGGEEKGHELIAAYKEAYPKGYV